MSCQNKAGSLVCCLSMLQVINDLRGAGKGIRTPNFLTTSDASLIRMKTHIVAGNK
jgi:hypothetical protein